MTVCNVCLTLTPTYNSPNGQIIADFVAWCDIKENMTVFGAPWQADAQLIFLARKYRKWIRGIISEDSDIWVYGR